MVALDYAGACGPAPGVGGDYCDFILEKRTRNRDATPTTREPEIGACAAHCGPLQTKFMPPNLRLRRVTQTIADLSGKTWNELRILDLGSLDGTFALEFASRGAQVLAIEGRESNNEAARSAAKSLGLDGVEFVTDDVRHFSREKFGAFDAILCSGILYHLPGEDGCRFIHAIAEACTRLLIIDTHVGLKREVSVSFGDKIYYGTPFKEHEESESKEQRLSKALASLDNPTSFWITKPSLLNLLRDTGFSSACEVLSPMSFRDYSDRITVAAIKGSPIGKSLLSPELEKSEEPDWPEKQEIGPYPPPVPRWKIVGGNIKRKLLGSNRLA